MKDYDQLGQVWLPYLMYFHKPNFNSKTVRTDAQGFRFSYKHDVRTDFLNQGPNALLLGGSFAFGVGATDDRYTVSSNLNIMTGLNWLNFGGRAFSSTQELLLFLFYYQQVPNIKKVVLLSGLNNLVLYYLSPSYLKELGAFYYQAQYEQAMNKSILTKKGKVFNLLKSFIAPDKRSDICSKNKGNKEDLLFVLKRDISIWKLLTKTLNIDLYYVLQPAVNWTNKDLTKEETSLFDELDKLPQNLWQILKRKMDYESYVWYCREIETACREYQIPFLDMNKAFSAKNFNREWLFVDRVHCNDRGYAFAAEIVKEQVI